MALVHLDFESQYLGSNTDVDIILPDKPRELTPEQFYSNGKKYRVLWLLHGTFGGYSDWIRKSNIELYACEHDIIVVMPGVGNSDYSAWDNYTLGYDSDKYIVDELMPMIYNWYPASSKREDNFIAGLSMGGGGTLHFALKYPEKFASAAVLSYLPFDYDAQKKDLEVLFNKKSRDVYGNKEDVMHSEQRNYNIMHKFDSVDEYLDSELNLKRVFEKADFNKAPKLMFACGSEDPIFANSIDAFKKYIEDNKLPIEVMIDSGSHEWRVWERDIQKAFKFFGFTDDAKGNAF